MDHLCYLWLVFVKLLCPFIAALRSLAGKELTCRLSLCFGHFPRWYAGSGVIPDCINA